MSVQLPQNSTGSTIDTLQPTPAKERQIACIGDPIIGANVQSVTSLHAADNQPQIASSFASLSTGVALLQNILGNTDRQREVGADNAPSLGIVSGGANFLMQAVTSDIDNFAAGVRTFTPAAMSGSLNGVAWSIQVGGTLLLDTGANQEQVLVTATTATTFTCTTTKAHNGSVTAFLVFVEVYNRERDAAGEQDGASGSGTNVAAEYEFNSGGPLTNAGAPSNLQFDRARNLQGKGVGSATQNAGGAAGAISITVSSAAATATISPGQQIRIDRNTGTEECAYVTKNFVPGTAAITLQSALQFTHTAATVEWDIFAPAGPGLSGFTPLGLGIEEEALFNPVDGKYYIERSATQDGMPAANIVAENPALWNGATLDRGRSGSAANVNANSAVGAELVMPPGQWSVFSTPVAATQATASQAAGGAGVRNVCQSISATFATGATAQAAALILNLRDGISGAGSIRWSKQIILPANGVWEVNISGLNIVGSVATAMTLEFAAAGAAGTFESVSMTGTTVQ